MKRLLFILALLLLALCEAGAQIQYQGEFWAYTFPNFPTPGTSIAQPLGNFGFISLTNPAGQSITINSLGVYIPVTNYNFAVTNQFGANLAKGALTNLVAGYYRITVGCSFIPPTPSDGIDTDLFINGTVTELIASHQTGPTGANKYCELSATGILYLAAGSWLQIGLTDTSSTGSFSVIHAQLTIGTP